MAREWHDTGTILGQAYNQGWCDGVDGIMCENPYTDAEERLAYDAGRAAGARYYVAHEEEV